MRVYRRRYLLHRRSLRFPLRWMVRLIPTFFFGGLVYSDEKVPTFPHRTRPLPARPSQQAMPMTAGSLCAQDSRSPRFLLGHCRLPSCPSLVTLHPAITALYAAARLEFLLTRKYLPPLTVQLSHFNL